MSPASRPGGTGKLAQVALPIHTIELACPTVAVIEEQNGVSTARPIAGNDVRPACPPAGIALDQADVALSIRVIELPLSRIPIVK